MILFTENLADQSDSTWAAVRKSVFWYIESSQEIYERGGFRLFRPGQVTFSGIHGNGILKATETGLPFTLGGRENYPHCNLPTGQTSTGEVEFGLGACLPILNMAVIVSSLGVRCNTTYFYLDGFLKCAE